MTQPLFRERIVVRMVRGSKLQKGGMKIRQLIRRIPHLHELPNHGPV